MQRDNFSAVKTAQQSFRPYQKKSQDFSSVETMNFKRPNPYLLDESQPQLHKNLKTENKFVPLLLQGAPSHSYTQQQALVYVNQLMAAQLQREYYQNQLANQFESLNLQLALYNAAINQSTPSQHVKKLESPSKVIVIDDDAQSDAETNITEGFYCSPKIHITQADEEFSFEEPEEPSFSLEEEGGEVKPQAEILPLMKKRGSVTAEIPRLNLNKTNDQKKKKRETLMEPRYH